VGIVKLRFDGGKQGVWLAAYYKSSSVKSQIKRRPSVEIRTHRIKSSVYGDEVIKQGIQKPYRNPA
jgi:hypothetical protein